MELLLNSDKLAKINRYETSTQEKAGGVAYTPKVLADFVAQQMLAIHHKQQKPYLKILDPAVGEGELLVSLIEQICAISDVPLKVYGFETDERALFKTIQRLEEQFPGVEVNIQHGSFLDYVLENHARSGNLFGAPKADKFDLVIANPPYVRTQIMGGKQARLLTEQFNLSGRVDLYYPFLLGISRTLAADGVAGVIVSNRFMTTKSGASIRQSLREELNIQQVWDLGDTKLFDVAVLPAVLLASGNGSLKNASPKFTSIYQTKEKSSVIVADPLDALQANGVVSINDGRSFCVKQGTLEIDEKADAVWRISSSEVDGWLETVRTNTFKKFSEIGKIRVGVKTCEDKVFIRSDWDAEFAESQPELLRDLITHHTARRYKADTSEKQWKILYTHEMRDGKRRPVDLANHPKSAAYLESHRSTLEGRSYVIEAGRRWYEIWVPQDPSSWAAPKLVFRDISERPTFWVDQSGGIVNGDCYWMIADKGGNPDLLWLAAGVANSSFIEEFYDHKFNNKLYAGRRRFITQYVEQFPLPDPKTKTAQQIISLARQVHNLLPDGDTQALEEEINQLVWLAFGLAIKEARG